MKKFFMFAAMASVALVSCVKNEPVATIEQGEAITFDVPVVGVPTKVAELTGTDYPTNRPFHVYAYYTEEGTDYTGTGEKYMDAVATYQSADPVCYSPGNYYWPKTGDLSFFAYSPSSVGATETAGKITFDYTVDTDPTKHVDLLYSDWAIDKTSVNNATNVGANLYNGIQLAFNHAMSVVKFNFKGTSADVAANIQITSVQLQNVLTAGTLTCDYDADPKAAWSDQDVKGNFNLLVTTPYQLEETDSEIDTDVYNLILLPQTLPGDAKLVVSYNIKNQVDDSWIPQTAAEIELNTATVDSVPLASWAMNTKYTYNVVFDLNKVYFAPAVVEYISETVVPTIPNEVL